MNVMANARKIAVTALTEVESEAAYSNLTLNKFLSESDLSKSDRSFVTALFYGVLDRKMTLDFVLGGYVKTPLDKMPTFTLCALRTAIYQIMYMDRIPDSAAVNETVNIIKGSKQRYQTSFVNAVLRNVLRGGYKLPQGDSIPSLSVNYSCPERTVRELINDYGKDTAVKLLSAALVKPPVVLRVNTLKTNSETLSQLLSDEGASVKQGDVSNSLTVENFPDMASSECFKKGLFHIQDTASQSAVAVLAPRAGERVADLCAAPGGKSFTMAQLMENKGELLAFDLYEKRVRLIEKGAKRLGISIIKAACGDASVKNDSLGLFDAVLCDVPCSGLGVIRRKPEIKYKPVGDFSELEGIQLKILENAAGYLKSGGRLLYSTCTLRKAENSGIIQAFLDKNPCYELKYERTYMPHTDGSDGFYCALLLRTGD